MRRFYLAREEIAKDMPAIGGDDARHIVQVLRLSAGDIIGLFDGSGVECEARIVSTANRRVTVSVIRRSCPSSESPVKITVVQGLLKDKKMDGLIRQLSEMGATRFLPLRARRSVPVPDIQRLSGRITRWEKIAIEAAKQCGRSRILQITEPLSLDEVLALCSQDDLKLVFWEKERQPLGRIALDPARSIQKLIILLGPEGGWDPAEVEQARACGFVTIGMGPRILRAETAAVAACALVQYVFGDMGQNVLDNHKDLQ
jgi:16S rRNA (uracil1498-N3)-methyltransferase